MFFEFLDPQTPQIWFRPISCPYFMMSDSDPQTLLLITLYTNVFYRRFPYLPFYFHFHMVSKWKWVKGSTHWDKFVPQQAWKGFRPQNLRNFLDFWGEFIKKFLEDFRKKCFWRSFLKKKMFWEDFFRRTFLGGIYLNKVS